MTTLQIITAIVEEATPVASGGQSAGTCVSVGVGEESAVGYPGKEAGPVFTLLLFLGGSKGQSYKL